VNSWMATEQLCGSRMPKKDLLTHPCLVYSRTCRKSNTENKKESRNL
jgi:hypothetical protein